MSKSDFGFYSIGILIGYIICDMDKKKISYQITKYKNESNTRLTQLNNYKKFIKYKELDDEYKNFKNL